MHSEYLEDSKSTQHKSNQETHFLQSHIILVARVRLLASLE